MTGLPSPPGSRQRLRPRLAAAVLAPALLLPGGTAGAQTNAQERLSRLEQQVRALTGRLAELERATAADDGAVATETAAGGVQWELEAPFGAGLTLSQKRFARTSGRVDLLARLDAPLAAARAGSRRAAGDPLPLAVVAETPDGAREYAVFQLLRGSRLAAGAFVHLRAELSPALAERASRLRLQSANAAPERR